MKAIDVAIINNAKKLGYIFKTLKDWEKRGLKTTEVKSVKSFGVRVSTLDITRR